jgi:carbon monoxide dehydrogenase subunit G
MIAAEHSVTVEAGIGQVWDYVKDIRQWALLFPGCKDCEVIDDNNSRWVIKVGAGGLVKTVNVLVTVEQWDGPQNVIFTYQLESEPVQGSGSYRAEKLTDNSTDIKLQMRVVGSGQMAPMWEAMSKPLLPQMAKAFSSRLKDAIEAVTAVEAEPKTEGQLNGLSRLWRWLTSLWAKKT